MSVKKIITIVILTMIIFGCEKEDPTGLEGKEISYNILEKGTFKVSGDNTINEQYLVFKDQEEWAGFISLMEFKSPEKAEEFKELSFDFNNKTLLIITSEHQNYCCKEIIIKKVYRDQGIIYVDFEVKDSNGTESNFYQSYLLFEVNKN